MHIVATRTELQQFLPESEHDRLVANVNTATQIINEQSRGWVYVMMELVGDYSENLFQGMANDIPMLSLCRVIEIDLREMLGETDLPPSVKVKNGILM